MTFLTYVEVSTKPPVPINIAHRAHAATSLDGIDGDGERMQQSLGAGWRRRSLNASSVELGNVHRKMEEEGRKFERERTWCCGKREGNRLNYGAIFLVAKTLVLFFFSSGYSTSGMHITEALLGDKLDNKVNSFFYFRKTCTLLRLCPIDLPSVKPNTNNTVSTPKWGDYSVFLNGIESTFTGARIMTAIMWHHNSRHRRQYRIADEGIYAALGTWFTLLSLNYIDPSIRNMWPYKTC